MIMEREEYEINGNKVELRCAEERDAQILIDYLRTVSGETRFLLCEPEEIRYTEEQERDFIRRHNESKTGMLILAFVNGEYAGNCSFDQVSRLQRQCHRASIGIALYQRFTGMGVGTKMLQRIIEEVRNAGYEKCELTVVEGNDGAKRLYERMGFQETGRIHRANKYKDGTYADDILMELDF